MNENNKKNIVQTNVQTNVKTDLQSNVENNLIIRSKIILVTIGLSGLGVLGIDRLYAGNYVLFFFKLITLGGIGIWAIIDTIRILYNIFRIKKTGIFGIDQWSDDPYTSLLYTIFVFILLGIIYSTIIYKFFGKKNKDIIMNGKFYNYMNKK